MTTNGARVEIGAIQAAWDQVTILRTGDNQRAWPELSQRIEAATALYGPGELLRGTVFLIDGALQQIGTGRAEGQRLADRFIITLLGKVAQWEGLVERTDFPIVRQVVQVSFEGGDPVTWRDQASPISDSEPRTMTCALALIADFVDRIDGPGACERVLLTSLGDVLD
ncbi:hypothetical protein ACWDBD_32315 [Streptomyces sp. NPDC001118]